MRAYRPNVPAAFVCFLTAAGWMAGCSVDLTSVPPADDAGADSSHLPQPEAGTDAPFDTATDAADAAPDAADAADAAPDAPIDSAPDVSPDAGDGGSPSACDSATELPVDGTDVTSTGATSTSLDRGSCAPAGADARPTAYFTFTIGAPGNYRIDVESSLGHADPSAAAAVAVIRATCSDAKSELACAQDVVATKTDAGVNGMNVGIAQAGSYALLLQGTFFAHPFSVSMVPTGPCYRDSDCPASAPRCDASGACTTTLTCSAPKADCDRRLADGCETDTSNDPDHCGACDSACAYRAGSTRACTSGACVYACQADSFDCDGEPSDGCECGPAWNAKVAACAAKACKLTCDAGWADCDHDPSDGCEQRTVWDNANCGGCGIVCGGATSCTDGQCLATATTIAPETSNIGAIAVDASRVYWLTYTSLLGGCDGAIKSAPTGGGAAATIASNVCSPSDMMIDDTWLYATVMVQDSPSSSHGAIMKYPKAGGAGSEAVTFANASAWGFKRDGDTFYVLVNTSDASQTSFGVMSAKVGAAPVSITTFSALPQALTLTPTDVVVLSGWPGNSIEVQRAPRGGGVPVHVATTQNGQDIAYAQGNLYVADTSQLTAIDASGATTPIPLPEDGGRLLVSGNDLYFSTNVLSDQPGMIAKMNLATRAITPLAMPASKPASNGTSYYIEPPLTLDATYVYFGDGARIARAPR